jgi:hypothetical protein
MSVNRAASIHARLLERAQRDGIDFNLMLARYALERWLYRLSISPARGEFMLKGALLFDLWFDLPHRPTRDADFLGFGPADAKILTRTVQTVCRISADDGMQFDSDSVNVMEIRKAANYDGLRVKFIGTLGKARCSIQLDVGYGDAVIPGPEEADYPTLLDGFPGPRLRVYPREAVVAEKLEAIIKLGMVNSRMKDYFDLWVLLRRSAFDTEVLGRAIASTCMRRNTDLPAATPLGLSDEFAQDATKRRQWSAFLRKNALNAPALENVVEELRDGLARVLIYARSYRQ